MQICGYFEMQLPGLRQIQLDLDASYTAVNASRKEQADPISQTANSNDFHSSRTYEFGYCDLCKPRRKYKKAPHIALMKLLSLYFGLPTVMFMAENIISLSL